MNSPIRSPKDKELRTQQILEAAEAVWLEHGLAGGAIDVIAAKVGIAKSTVYLYWEKQRELMEAVRQKLIDRLTISQGEEMAPALVLLAELELAMNREQLVRGVRRPGVANNLYVALTDAR